MHILGHQWTLADVHQEVKHDTCQSTALRIWLRVEEATGSNPATPTMKLQVEVLFRDGFRLLNPAAFRFWERTGADLVQPTSLISGNAPLFVGRVGAAAPGRRIRRPVQHQGLRSSTSQPRDSYPNAPNVEYLSLFWSGNNRSAHAQIVAFAAGTGNERQPGIRLHLWVALCVDARCSDTVAGRRRDGAGKRSRRGALYCQRRPILTPGCAGVSVHVPVDGYKEDGPPKPRAWLRDAAAIGRPDDSPRGSRAAG